MSKKSIKKALELNIGGHDYKIIELPLNMKMILKNYMVDI